MFCFFIFSVFPFFPFFSVVPIFSIFPFFHFSIWALTPPLPSPMPFVRKSYQVLPPAEDRGAQHCPSFEFDCKCLPRKHFDTGPPPQKGNEYTCLANSDRPRFSFHTFCPHVVAMHNPPSTSELPCRYKRGLSFTLLSKAILYSCFLGQVGSTCQCRCYCWGEPPSP